MKNIFLSILIISHIISQAQKTDKLTQNRTEVLLYKYYPKAPDKEILSIIEKDTSFSTVDFIRVSWIVLKQNSLAFSLKTMN
ncbi:MAG: hypothetical protein K2X86_17930 [Cytophagaceae bacterium]|nr:hypothetical protein [Cytophagaceae bacterium]